MGYGKIETNDKYIEYLTKKSKVIYCIFVALFILNIVVSVSLCAMVVLSSLFDGSLVSDNVAIWYRMLNIILFGSLLGALFFIFMSIFRAILKGDSPFTLKQVKRMRIISFIWLAYALIEFLLSLNAAPLILEQYVSLGQMENYQANASISSINLMAILFGIIAYGFSNLVEYGVVLQDQADESL